jgi:hypothetical protein
MFPVGLPLQTIMWSAPSDGAYVRLRYEGSTTVDYQFAAGPTSPGEITLPQQAWNEVARLQPSILSCAPPSPAVPRALQCTGTSRPASPAPSAQHVRRPRRDPRNGAIMRLSLRSAQSGITGSSPAKPTSSRYRAPHVVSCCRSAAGPSRRPRPTTWRRRSRSVLQGGPPCSRPRRRLPNALRCSPLTAPACSRWGTRRRLQRYVPRKPNNFPPRGPDTAKLLDVATRAGLMAKASIEVVHVDAPVLTQRGRVATTKPDGKGGRSPRARGYGLRQGGGTF